MRNYQFDKKLSRKVLENYLSRAVTAGDLIHSETIEDDIRAIINIGAKFLGRAACAWIPETDQTGHFSLCRQIAEMLHEKDPDIILQACIFEIVFTRVDQIQVPIDVLEAFGQPLESRCFSYEKMIFEERPYAYVGEDNGTPDITRTETAMWFYYLATRYIDAGFEALHMGQVHLYTANDTSLTKTYELFQKIRDYGYRNARRHKVLMDAHTHGVSVNGKLLFDYHAMPFSRMPLLLMEGEKLALVREGFSEGGINPNGFSGDTMPYLMELDNWGGLASHDSLSLPREQRAYTDWWGYDQIAWFTNQNEGDRNHFLEYAWKWVAVNNVNAYFEMPFRRCLDAASMPRQLFGSGEKKLCHYYQANMQSERCPLGFSQEETIKELWEREDTIRSKFGNPEAVNDFGGEEVYDVHTGVKLPSRVVLYGDFQPYVGAIANDSNSETTRMYYVGNNTYSLSMVLPYAGEYHYAVSTYGTMSAIYTNDRFPRSGSNHKAVFRTEKDNTIVNFRFDYSMKRVSFIMDIVE